MTEKINLLQALHDAAHQQARQSNPDFAYFDVFHTIEKNNVVRKHNFITKTLIQDCAYTICSLGRNYNSFGWKTGYSIYAIVDSSNNVISEMTMEDWTLSDLNFIHAAQGNEPTGKATFLLKDSSEPIELELYWGGGIQAVWDFFVDLSIMCKTVGEAKIYRDFFIHKLKNKVLDMELATYKQQVSVKETFLKEHKLLLEKIEGMIDRCCQD